MKKLIPITLAFYLLGFAGLALQYKLTLPPVATKPPLALAPTQTLSSSPTPAGPEAPAGSPLGGATPTPIPKTLGVQASNTPEPTKEASLIATSGDHMATPAELFLAINAYRSANGRSAIAQSETLCAVAQARANDQEALGHLDHSGFDAQAKSQTEFHHFSEILQYRSEPTSATYFVFTG